MARPQPRVIFLYFNALIFFMTSAKYYSGDKLISQAF